MPQIIEVPGHGQVEFPDGMSDQDITGAIQKNLSPPSASMGDRIAGTPLARLAMGAASPLIGAAQLGAHVGDVANRAMGVEPVVSPWIDAQLARYKSAKERGMKASGTDGYDWMGLLGSLAPTSMMAKGIGAALPQATSVLGRAGVGAVQGGAAAAAQPVENTDEGFWQPKGAQAALGTVMGGAVPLAIDAGKGIGKIVTQAAQPFTEKGRAAILQDFRNAIMGQDPVARQRMIQEAANAKPGVGGVMPTVGEVTSGIPDERIAAQSTGIAAHQKDVARLSGISPEFTDRAAAQNIARATAIQDTLSPYVNPDVQAMKSAVEKRAFPLKEEALNAANQLNVMSGHMKGMPISKLTANLYDVEKQVEGNAPLEKYLQSLRERITEKARSFNPSGTKIDANVLANMRDQVKNDISGLAGNERISKKALQKYTIDAEQAIDKAIEDAGKTGKWDEWRRVYSGGMQEIDRVNAATELAKASRGTAGQFEKAASDMADSRWMQPHDKMVIDAVLAEKQRAANMGKLANQTSLSGKDAIPGDLGVPLPNLLYRPAMIANFMMKHVAKGAEEKIGKLAAQQYLNPPAFAQAMQSVPPRYQPMIDALMRQAPAMAGTMAGRTQ